MLHAVILLAVPLSVELGGYATPPYDEPDCASRSPYAPAEPSTLVLAAIGTGLLGGYAATRRWRSTPRSRRSGNSPAPATRPRIARDQRKRGAA